MRRLLLSSPVILLVLAACANQEDPGPPPVPGALAAPSVVAEAAAIGLPLKAQVLAVRRTGPDVLTVTLQLVNTGGPGQSVALGSLFATDVRDAGTLADMYLWDEPGQRKYYLLRDKADRPRSSVGLADLLPGAPRSAWAAFPAPPAGVTQLTICVPHLPPMPGVPIT